jgi:signal-transduction protein with cAMP-binding, CBS, and nucleotidyltransferase domain
MGAMKVSDMMSVNLVTCSPDHTVRDAARQMDARGVGSVIVIENGAMTGIFTERDLVRLVARGTPLHAARVGDHAAGDVASVPPDTDAAEAAAVMNRLRIRHLPVTDGATPLGMVSLRDFFALSGAVLRAQGAEAASTLLRAAT